MSENEIFAENLSFEEEMDKTLVKIRPGQIITGKVIYAKEDEVSVDIGYKADGLITKEELTASGAEDPKALFNEGDEIEVEVVKVIDGNGNVILSRKKVIARLEADKTLQAISNGEIFENKTSTGESVEISKSKIPVCNADINSAIQQKVCEQLGGEYSWKNDDLKVYTIMPK